MRRLKIITIVALIGIGGFVSVYVTMPWYRASAIIHSAQGELARAQTAQTPDEVIQHVKAAKPLLPISGSVSQWSPDRGDFETIQAELDGILLRARNISSLESENELFVSEMNDIHAKLQTIQEALAAF